MIQTFWPRDSSSWPFRMTLQCFVLVSRYCIPTRSKPLSVYSSVSSLVSLPSMGYVTADAEIKYCNRIGPPANRYRQLMQVRSRVECPLNTNRLQNMCYYVSGLVFRNCEYNSDFLREREIGVSYDIWSVLCWFLCEIFNRDFLFFSQKLVVYWLEEWLSRTQTEVGFFFFFFPSI